LGILGSCVDTTAKAAATAAAPASTGLLGLGFLGLKTVENLKMVTDGETTAENIQKTVEIATEAIQRRLAAEAAGEIPVYGSAEATALYDALRTYGSQI
jgi:hypothetical protein